MAEQRPTTVRAVYYQCVSQGIVPKDEQHGYDPVQRRLTVLREIGIVGYNVIVDPTREMRIPSSWSSPADILDTVTKAYRRDIWEQAPWDVVLISEKDTVVGNLQPSSMSYWCH